MVIYSGKLLPRLRQYSISTRMLLGGLCLLPVSGHHAPPMHIQDEGPSPSQVS